MAVVFEFSNGGKVLTEAVPLDFGVVQAGLVSEAMQVYVTNKGNSDALMCVITAVAASVSEGFSTEAQVGTALETYGSQKFAELQAGPFSYDFAVVGVGKNYLNRNGGTLANTSGIDSFWTIYAPPALGTSSGEKFWANKGTCVYV